MSKAVIIKSGVGISQVASGDTVNLDKLDALTGDTLVIGANSTKVEIGDAATDSLEIKSALAGDVLFDKVISSHSISAVAKTDGSKGIDLVLSAGSTTNGGDGGQLLVLGGASELTSGASNGGELALQGGSCFSATGRGGLLTLQGGYSENGPGGHVFIAPGQSNGTGMGGVFLGADDTAIYAIFADFDGLKNKGTAPGLRYDNGLGVKKWQYRNEGGPWIDIGSGGSTIPDGTAEGQLLVWSTSWAAGDVHIVSGVAAVAMPAGTPVAKGPGGFGFMVWNDQPWKDHAVGLLLEDADEGAAVRVQVAGPSKPISHLRWASKPNSGDVGKYVYAEPSGILTLNANPNYSRQAIGVIEFADDTVNSDTTRVLINVGGLTPNVLAATAGGTGLSSFAKGDILYASGVNTLNKLTIGSVGQILTVSGGVPVWDNPSSSLVGYTSSTQTSLGVGASQVERYSVHIGANAGSGLTGGSNLQNVCIGDNTGPSNANSSTPWNVFVGYGAGRSTSMVYGENTFVGHNACPQNIGKSVVIGQNAAALIHPGNLGANLWITAVGHSSGSYAGYKSVSIGANAGYVYGGTPTSSTNNCTYIGADAGTRGEDFKFSIAIGSEAVVGATRCCVIGGTNTSANTVNVGINMEIPTAQLHLPAGLTTAGKAPLKLTAGALLSAVENGAVEFNGSALYATIGGVRKRLDYPDGGVPASGVQESNTGNVYVVSGTSVIVAPPSTWWNTNSAPSGTAPAANRVTVTGLTIKPGQPMRVLTKSALVYNGNNFPKVSSADASTIKGSNLDRRMSAYYKSVRVSGTQFIFQVYSEESCVNLIGQSAQFEANATGTTSPLAVTALNGSNYTATLYAQTSTEDQSENIVHRVSYGRTGICTSYNASTGALYFAGQALPLTANYVVEVWQGLASNVVSKPFSLPGSYAYTTSQAFKDRLGILVFWDNPPGTICQLMASHGIPDSGATQPKIALVNNSVQLVADGSALSMSASADTRVSTAVEMSAVDLAVAYGNRLELRVIGGSGTTAPGDLCGTIQGVLD